MRACVRACCAFAAQERFAAVRADTLSLQAGNTALHLAAGHAARSPLPVAALLAAGAEADARNAAGETPLFRFVKKAPLPPTPVDTDEGSIMSLLIARGADVNATDRVRCAMRAAHSVGMLTCQSCRRTQDGSSPLVYATFEVRHASAAVPRVQRAAARQSVRRMRHLQRTLRFTAALAPQGKVPVLERLLAPDASPNMGVRARGKSLVEMARSPAARHLLRGHPASPVGRLSRLIASAAGTGAGLAAARAAGEPLLCSRAVLATSDGRGIASAAQLGSAQLPHATCRLAAGGASPFAYDAPIEGQRSFAERLAALSLAPDAALPPPERDGTHVAAEVLRQLLPTPPTDWQPLADNSFGFGAADVGLLCDAAEACFRAERCAHGCLLRSSSSVLMRSPLAARRDPRRPVLRLRAPVKIYGDTHGQMRDLLRLFAAFGAPSDTGDLFATDYLFIGDYVDRGAHQLEVVCLLLALKVAHPGQVHLLRGNHEIREVNELSYDFLKHCRSRLGAHGCSTRLRAAALPWTDPVRRRRARGLHGARASERRVRLDAARRRC
jgi:hypothetical protein